jgi:hypothetical protein
VLSSDYSNCLPCYISAVRTSDHSTWYTENQFSTYSWKCLVFNKRDHWLIAYTYLNGLVTLVPVPTSQLFFHHLFPCSSTYYYLPSSLSSATCCHPLLSAWCVHFFLMFWSLQLRLIRFNPLYLIPSNERATLKAVSTHFLLSTNAQAWPITVWFVLWIIWRRSLSKCYLRIQSVPQREHHTSPLQRSTG